MARNNNGMTVSEFVNMCNAYQSLINVWSIGVSTPDDYNRIDWSYSYGDVMDFLKKYGNLTVTDFSVGSYKIHALVETPE